MSKRLYHLTNLTNIVALSSVVNMLVTVMHLPTANTADGFTRGEATDWYMNRFYLDNKLLDVDALKAVIDNFAPNSTTGWMVANFHCTFSNWADDAKVETMVNNLRTMIQYAISKGIIFVSSEVGAMEYLY